MTTVSKKTAVTIGAFAIAAAINVSLTGCAAVAAPPSLRPPATPLVTTDPFLSIWSKADRLTDASTQHWTNRDQPLVSLVRIDG